MTTATHPTLVAFNWRVWILAGAAASMPTAPTFALRIGALLCAFILLTKLPDWKIAPADVYAILLTTLAAASTVWAEDRTVTALAAKNQVAVLAIFLSVRAVVSRPEHLRVLSTGYLAGCLYAIYLMVRDSDSISYSPDLGDVRYGIIGLNYNYMAYALATGLIVVVILWQLTSQHFLLVIIAALLSIAIELSGSRGALAAAVFLGLWLAIIKGFRRAHQVGLKFIIFLVLVLSLATVTGWADFILRVVDEQSVRATGDLAGRLTTWPIAREVFSRHPFIGIGSGGFLSANPIGIGAHNVVLEIGTGMGLLGIALFLMTLSASLLRSTRSMDSRRRSLLVGGLIATMSPIYLSGHWELSPAAWVVIAIVSRAHCLTVGSASLTRPTDHGSCTPLC